MKSGLLLINLQGFHAPSLFVYSRGQAVPESIKGWETDQSSSARSERERQRREQAGNDALQSISAIPASQDAAIINTARKL